MIILPRSFYERSPLEVAPELLGKILVHKVKGQKVSGRIVEVEAYLGAIDAAAHAFIGKTKRNQSLFGEAGHAYMHSIHLQQCLDIVTEPAGIPTSVLIRALEPVEGIETMKKLRNKEKLLDLTTGPGKLTQALAITKEYDGCDVTNPQGELFVVDDGFLLAPLAIIKSRRIGITKAAEHELRFSIKDNQFVSKKVKT